MKWYKKQMDALNIPKEEHVAPHKGQIAKRVGHTPGAKNSERLRSVPSPVAASKLQRKKTDSI